MAKREAPSKRRVRIERITQLSQDQFDSMRSTVSSFWQPIKRDAMPPHGVNVLVKVNIHKNLSRVYTGKFRYDVEDCVDIGGHPIPLNKAKHHGITAWMPIPN